MRPEGPGADREYDRPSAARVYDYFLGGSHNFAVDRKMARQAIAMWPELPQIMQANRVFLRRAVEYLVGNGVTQFLDIGSGIPTVGNVHEVAQRLHPDARVVYVDIDPVAVAHSREILAGNDRTAVVAADFRDVAGILDSPEVARLLDLTQPVGLLLVALLHFVPTSDDPAAVIARYAAALAPGSHLVVSHASRVGPPDQVDEHEALYQRTGTPMTMRSRAEVMALFSSFDLVAPGLVYLPQWRPEPGEVVNARPERFPGLAAVGRKS